MQLPSASPFVWLTKPVETMWQMYPFFVNSRQRMNPARVYHDWLVANNTWSRGQCQEKFQKILPEMIWCSLNKSEPVQLQPFFYKHFFFPNEWPSVN